jgi:hypothetical protein
MTSIAEYVKNWQKLHDVSFSVEDDQTKCWVKVSFNGQQLVLSDYLEMEVVKTALYDMVYGVRESTPDTVRL